MDSAAKTSKSRDILSSPKLAFGLWWLPPIAIVATASSGFSVAWRTIVWIIALGLMATGCIVNALRCGRVHCYFTGPFFLLMAIVTLLFGIGILPLGRNGWNWIGLTILLGAIAFYYLPEVFLGKYRRSPAGSNERQVSPPPSAMDKRS